MKKINVIIIDIEKCLACKSCEIACAESLDLGTGMFVYSPVGSISASAGKIAGRNAAGASRKTRGFLRAQADEILTMQIYSIGHSSTTAKEVGLKVKVHELDVAQPAEQWQNARTFEMGKLLTDEEQRIVGAQLVSRRYGSQFAWQLYQAVLNSENREQFLERFNSPRMKIAEALVHAVKSAVVVESINEGKALKLADASGE